MNCSPNKTFNNIIVLMPIEISGVHNLAPRQVRMPVAYLTRQSASSLRNDFQGARSGIKKYAISLKFAKCHVLDHLSGKQNVIANMGQCF